MDAYGERIYAMECARAIKDIKDNYYAGYRVMGGAAALLLQKVAPWILEDESSGEEANP